MIKIFISPSFITSSRLETTASVYELPESVHDAVSLYSHFDDSLIEVLVDIGGPFQSDRNRLENTAAAGKRHRSVALI
jgi:hypothetical protein